MTTLKTNKCLFTIVAVAAFLFCGTGVSIGQTSMEDLEKRVEALEKENAVDIGGALRYNYIFEEHNQNNKDKDGVFAFELFRLDVDGEINDITISAQYRWYSYMDVIHHGWIGYSPFKNTQVQLGLTQVPFGLLPYASHNWWFAVPYYIGLEDDYDAGVKVVNNTGPFNIQVAYFKNGDWGNAGKLERYSYDVVTGGAQQNEEINQFNGRFAFNLKHGEIGSTEFGASAQRGELYNNTTGDKGTHEAYAGHVNGNYGPLNVMLEYAKYKYEPENPAGVSDETVLVGALADSYLIAAEGELYIVNVAFNLPLGWGPITGLTFYNDYSILKKEENGWDDSIINTTGVLVSASPVFVYFDYIQGDSMIYLNTDDSALTDGDDEKGRRFNVNIGYYF